MCLHVNYKHSTPFPCHKVMPQHLYNTFTALDASTLNQHEQNTYCIAQQWICVSKEETRCHLHFWFFSLFLITYQNHILKPSINNILMTNADLALIISTMYLSDQATCIGSRECREAALLPK